MPTIANFVNLQSFFFFNDTATTEIYTLSLHDALPILRHQPEVVRAGLDLPQIRGPNRALLEDQDRPGSAEDRSEEHTSELQSPCNLVCRLLLEKKTLLIDGISIIESLSRATKQFLGKR